MKHVIFDFDGTLTYKSCTIWKSIWKDLGYSVDDNSYYRELFNNFVNGKISHQDWCNLTCDAFKKKNMNINHINKIVKEIKLIDGLESLLKELKKRNYSLHIVSGNIVDVIEKALGNLVCYFDSINANDMCFDKENRLTYINGTKYDFSGKADFVENLKKKNIPASNIIFIGNGGNDEWVYLSGCKTICINPEDINGENKIKWHICYNNLTNIYNILPEIIN